MSLAMIAEEAPPGAKGRLIAFSHVLSMTAIGTVLALQALVGDLGTIGARIMWLHLLVLALVVLVLRPRMPESKEWAAERERARTAPPQDAEGHHLDAGNELLPLVFGPSLVTLVAWQALSGVGVAFTTALGWFWIRRMPPGQDVEKALEEGVSPREAFSLA